jgi:hypothetical protein
MLSCRPLKTRDILERQWDLLEAASKRLLEVETFDEKELQRIVEAFSARQNRDSNRLKDCA